jgi:hypothetical protein
MARRSVKWWSLGLVVAWCCLPTALGALAGLPAPNQPAPAPARSQDAPEPFRHGAHLAGRVQGNGRVAPIWHLDAKAEQFGKHCQFCHDFEAGTATGLRSPTQKCATCHFSDGGQAGGDAARLQLAGGEPAPKSRAVTYDHGLPGHRERACVDCHRWSSAPGPDEIYADVQFELPTSLVVCIDCHHHGATDPGREQQQAMAKPGEPAAWRARWDAAESCGACHKAGAPRLLDTHRRTATRVFEHASHVPPTDVGPDGRAGSCRGCHTVNERGAVGMDVQAKGCDECHFGADGAVTTRTVEDLQVERMPTQFSHATEGHQKDCQTCHPMAAGAADPDVGRMYADCTKTCHSERRVERHGAWSCQDCHAHPDPRNETDARDLATAATARPAGGSRFRFGGALHPGVVRGGAAVHPMPDGRQCSDCHRRPGAGLAQASEARAFDHDGHLAVLDPSTPDSACTACHVHIAETTSPQFVHAFVADSAAERQNCTVQCHQSARFDVDGQPVAMTVPKFNHAQHGAHACVECHLSAGRITGGRGASLTGDAPLACARCHGHRDPEKVKITGGYTTTGAAGSDQGQCRLCHVPKEQPRYEKVARREQRFQLAGDTAQFHEKTGACRSCHALDDRDRGRPVAPLRIVSHTSLHKPQHEVRAADGSVRRLAGVDNDRTKNCLSCHAWSPEATARR